MANFEPAAAAISTTLLVATSADPQARGNAGSFVHPIRSFTVDNPAAYMVALVDLSFTHPGTGAVFVSTNLAGFTRVGSQMVNTIYRIPLMAAGEQHVEQTGSIIRWYPYASMDTASEVQIQLTDAMGNTIPAAGVTTVTLAIRRV